MTHAELRTHIKALRFKEAFAGLGWNDPRLSPFDRIIAGDSYRLTPIAEQAGIHAFEVTTLGEAKEPDKSRRKALDTAISSQFNRNILVFVDRGRHSAHVEAVIYRDGKRLQRGFPYQPGRPTEPIARLFKSLDIPYEAFDEEGNVASTQVIEALDKAFSADKVTKKFFKEFSDRRKGFVRFLEWIEDESKREWYCSVLLNRLMFIYFIAERGFLTGGKDYLKNKLAENARANGPDTFYTQFLLPLSFFGLGRKHGERGRFESVFKGVLYLNGGLFAIHSLEQELGISVEAVEAGTFPNKAKIPDSEFQNWFDYFGAWRWTLDEEKSEDDISPHILGYIFEKYVNQKQMGAYYTKEDITGYICRNTIIPRLFDMLAETGEKGKKSVDPLPVGPHPNLLNKGLGVSQGEGIDRYIYTAVNQTALLPTETEYEFKQRQKRYESILQDFEDGKISQINDFITYNLDLERLAVDFVATIQNPEVLWALWDKCLTKITVLDPTCGSGAFLFAALKILFPLYEAALRRMNDLVEAAGHDPVPISTIGGRMNMPEVEVQPEFAVPSESADREVYAKFESVLREVTKDHPHADYFIKKKIIVQNLYGVDIMEEAVEICKLRLFLELMRTVEKDDSKENFGVEPLPDIDFNILAGNSLVGFTSIEAIDRLWGLASRSEGVRIGSLLATVQDHDPLRKSLNEYATMLGYFRRLQLGEGGVPSVSKAMILRAGKLLRSDLNENLFDLYAKLGLVRGSENTARRIDPRFKNWTDSHCPFHWLIELPSIESRGGFDVVIGNPPYIEMSKVKSYRIAGLETQNTGNLYAPIIEQIFNILRSNGRASMIVPLSLGSTDRMRPIRERLLSAGLNWFSFFSGDANPSHLFEGVKFRLTVFVTAANDNESTSARIWAGPYSRWFSDARPQLFQLLRFVPVFESVRFNGLLPKLGEPILSSAIEKVMKLQRLEAGIGRLTEPIYVHRVLTMFTKCFDFVPFFRSDADGVKKSEDYKPYCFNSELNRQVALAVLNSSTFFVFFTAFGDCFHAGKEFVEGFPVGLDVLSQENRDQLCGFGKAIIADFKLHAKRIKAFSQQSGKVEYDQFWPSNSKPIIDEIDRVLAKHYGFTDEELEFIINYDIKYRMGRDASEEE